MTKETSNTWLQDLNHTDPKATGWRYLLESYEPFIRDIIRRYGLDDTAAADVAQNVLIVVARKLPDFERQRRGSFRTWLRSITRNCLRDYQKSRQHRSRGVGGTEMLDLAKAMEDDSSDLTKQWNRQHASHVLEELLKAVAPEFSENSIRVFRALAIENRPVEDVANDLGMTKNACIVARSRVYRRLKLVAQELFNETEKLFGLS